MICSMKVTSGECQENSTVKTLGFKRRGSTKWLWLGNLCVCAHVCERDRERKGNRINLSRVSVAKWRKYLGSHGQLHKTAVQRSADGLTPTNLTDWLWFWYGRAIGWKVAHILLKHSLALDHTWIPWDSEGVTENKSNFERILVKLEFLKN